MDGESDKLVVSILGLMELKCTLFTGIMWDSTGHTRIYSPARDDEWAATVDEDG